MQLSFFTMPLHPVQRDYRETLHEDRAAVLLADELGFSEAFIGEHVTDLAETITSSLTFIASLAYETHQIRLGTGTLNLPNTHPATVAAQVAMVDHMCDGRFILGISPGGLRSDAEAFGTLDLDRNAMVLEAITQVLALWQSDAPYELKGEFWQISTARTLDREIGQGLILKPFQRPHPPIAVACVSPHSESVARAAAQGWSIISANFLQPVWVKSHWQKMLEGAARGGRTARAQDWRVARSIFVADDTVTARAYAKSVQGPYGHYYKSLMRKLIGNGRPQLFKTQLEMNDDAITLEFVLDSLVLCGTVEQVVEQILALRENVGDFGTLVYAGHDWADPALARRSMILMAEQVMPRVNQLIR
ncbi:MAG: LLM class flavin-dependent oxidoreductase [Gammaproteobacteria bacterium]|nr:LLM class flavin-dependent oxidoreductase [Gammaproteobacteria bacterium]